MNGVTPTHDRDKDQDGSARPEPHEDTSRSGEGATTALEAMIRQRKLAEGPDPGEPQPPPGR
jgi:hypothetical protein